MEKIGKSLLRIFEVFGHKYGVSRFCLDFATENDPAQKEPRDPAFPYGLMANVYLEDRTFVGQVLHEFKDQENGGLLAKFSLNFPENCDPEMIHGHMNHLSLEWLNWFNAARNSRKF